MVGILDFMTNFIFQQNGRKQVAGRRNKRSAEMVQESDNMDRTETVEDIQRFLEATAAEGGPEENERTTVEEIQEDLPDLDMAEKDGNGNVEGEDNIETLEEIQKFLDDTNRTETPRVKDNTKKYECKVCHDNYLSKAELKHHLKDKHLNPSVNSIIGSGVAPDINDNPIGEPTKISGIKEEDGLGKAATATENVESLKRSISNTNVTDHTPEPDNTNRKKLKLQTTDPDIQLESRAPSRGEQSEECKEKRSEECKEEIGVACVNGLKEEPTRMKDETPSKTPKEDPKDSSDGLPPGWTRICTPRQTGDHSRCDYYVTNDEGLKFRSQVRFMVYLAHL